MPLSFVLNPRQNTLQTKTRQLTDLIPFLTHFRQRALAAQLPKLPDADIDRLCLLMYLEQLLQILAGDQAMELVFLLEAEPLKHAFVPSRRVACLAGLDQVVRGIIAASVFGYQVIGGKVFVGAAKHTFVRQFLLAFPFADGPRDRYLPVSKFLEAVGNKGILDRSVG